MSKPAPYTEAELIAKIRAGMLNSDAHDGDDPWWAIAATTQPRANTDREPEAPLPTIGPAKAGVLQLPARAPAPPPIGDDFVPEAPQSLEEAGLTESEVEALALKLLLNRSALTGRKIASHIRLPFALMATLLEQMKHDRLVVYKAAAPLGDYLYAATEQGEDRARRYSKLSSYFGAAPVPLKDYEYSVAAQTIRKQHPGMKELEKAFADLMLDPITISDLGQAVQAGSGLFLHGAPGNGKTSIAERVVRAYGPIIWIPRAISIAGEIIRLFDPSNHEVAPLSDALEKQYAEKIDQRWVRIKRPTVIAGGELTLESLEVTRIASTGISEAPLHLKSNCGCLVIDDFGRQRVEPRDILNRWIYPLDRHCDFLNLPTGRKVQVPFDQLLVFSTNLEPRQLVDEAFLRRIPNKIEVHDPTPDVYRQLFTRAANEMGITCDPGAINYAIRTFYMEAKRPMRACHPRDLLRQVAHYCSFRRLPLEVTPEALDTAARTYFAIM